MKTLLKTGIITLLTFATFLVATTNVNAQSKSETEKTYVKINVDGLSCPFCAYGLEKKLKKIKTVSDIEIFLEEGIAVFSVSKSEEPTKETLKKIVKNAGFTPKNIVFSENVFKLKDDE
jgi:copper chaperone CopZ